MRIVSHQALTWKGPVLYFKRRKMFEIVQDAKYPTMWRVRHADGRLSDMVNLTRARDAATGLALAALNSKGEESARGAAYSDFGAAPLSD
jgi:hypothetical protein